MKRLAALLTITLTILALPGCVQDKPTPRLGSPDRNQRIEAVHAAQNRYGVEAKPAANRPAPDGEVLVGRWNATAVEFQNCLEFYPDGTLKESNLLVVTKANWRVLAADKFQIRIYESTDARIIPGTVQVFKYSIVGNALWMTTPKGETVCYTRSKYPVLCSKPDKRRTDFPRSCAYDEAWLKRTSYQH